MTTTFQNWQKICISIVGGIFLGISCVYIPSVSALSVPAPSSFSGVESGVKKLEQDIEKAECGGWNMDKSVVGTVATVTGVPGRDGDPLGALAEYGMATRVENGQLLDDGFQFPPIADVHGWTTACKANADSPPYYEDTAGQTPCEDPKSCEKLCARINRWQWPKWQCLYYDGNGDVQQKLLPKICLEHKGNALDAPPAPAAPSECFDVIFLGWFYCCTDKKVTRMFYDQCTEANKDACLAHPDGGRNCLRCEGDGASKGGGVDFHEEALDTRNETGCRVGRERETGAGATPDFTVAEDGRKHILKNIYVSFYRAYKASFSRQAITPETPKDNASEVNIPVYCYGRYLEFDPKLKRTVTIDKKCIFDISGHEPISKEKMKVSQQRKFFDRAKHPDPPFETSNEDKTKSLWSNSTHDAVSGNSTSYDLWKLPFLRAEKIAQRSTVQMTRSEPRSSGALLRAFDETPSTDPIEPYNPKVENRQNSIVQWWHDQQTTAHTLFTPPVLRMVLPSAWSIDLNPLQQLLTPEDLEELVQKTRANPILQPVEVELEIRDDLLGEVAEFLQNSLLLQLQEEKIPVAVTLASATELRAVRERWCHWYKVTEKKDTCDSASGNIGDLLKKLEKYAIHMDDYRKLRAELPDYAAEYLGMHTKIQQNIGKWILDNGQKFVSYQNDIEELRILKATWEATQQSYRKFHDQSNLPWCMNQRFTTPIYSMLDPWKPDRPDLDYKLEMPEIYQKGMPYLKAERQPDLLFDLTHLSVSTGVVKIPVLEPIVIKYDLEWLHAPAETNTDAVIPTLPDLPAIPSIAQYFNEDELPKIQVGNSLPDLITLPDIVTNMDHNRQHMLKIYNIIRSMESEYYKFWNSLRRMTPRENVCSRPNGGRCIHVEMDLMERWRRIGSRPGLLLKEDFVAIGTFRNPAVEGYDDCNNKDWACQLQNPQNTAPRKGWGVIIPKLESLERFIDQQRKAMVEQTLLHGIPVQSSPEQILPSFDVPVEIHLFTVTGSTL